MKLWINSHVITHDDLIYDPFWRELYIRDMLPPWDIRPFVVSKPREENMRYSDMVSTERRDYE